MPQAINEDLKTFANPEGTWGHDAPFLVEVTDEANKSLAPASVKWEGNTAHFSKGRVGQSMGGIDITTPEKVFGWDYPSIKVIRHGDGKLIWVNRNYRDN